MWKQNRGKIILTSLATLLPCLIGLILWPRLPEQMPIHFDFSGTADGWNSKPFAVFAIPGFLFACHIICTLAMLYDPKGENIGRKIISVLMWVMPVVSVTTSMCIYAYALNVQINVTTIFMSLMGVLNIVMGNMMPKLRHNYTVGIRTSWTLADPENWYHTHRVGGWAWVITGIIMLAASLWMSICLLLVLLAAATAVPVVYSFVYYKRHGEKS